MTDTSQDKVSEGETDIVASLAATASAANMMAEEAIRKLIDVMSENATLRKERDQAVEALRIADEALALVPVDDPRCGEHASKARVEISLARSLTQTMKGDET